MTALQAGCFALSVWLQLSSDGNSDSLGNLKAALQSIVALPELQSFCSTLRLLQVEYAASTVIYSCSSFWWRPAACLLH